MGHQVAPARKVSPVSDLRQPCENGHTLICRKKSDVKDVRKGCGSQLGFTVLTENSTFSQHNHALPHLFFSSRTHKYLVLFGLHQRRYFPCEMSFPSTPAEFPFTSSLHQFEIPTFNRTDQCWCRSTVASLPEGGAVRICVRLVCVARALVRQNANHCWNKRWGSSAWVSKLKY